MAVVVIGGEGWVSRTAVAYYFERAEKTLTDICVYGSFSRFSRPISGVTHPIKIWIPQEESFRVETFIPAAFLTIDKFLKYGETEYRKRNLDLISNAYKYIEMNKPEKCILFSSGIVSLPPNQIEPKSPKAAYRDLKIEEEERLIEACENSNTNLIICRLFNSSGRYISNPRSYALSNFIYQGILTGKITVDSPHQTWRRYSDLGQIIEVCDRLLIEKSYKSFESGGIVVELHKLAQHIASFLNIQFHEKSVNNEIVDSYLSKSGEFESMAEILGVKLFGIEDQIRNTQLGVEEYILRNT